MENTENVEIPEIQLNSLIPSNYKTKIVSCKKEDHGFIAILRVAISTKSEALKWLEAFSEISFCTFKVDRTYPENSQKLVFKKEFRCHHNTRPTAHRVYRHHPKHTGCNAKLTITIKQKDLKRSKDPYLKMYPTVIYLRHVHNHLIKSPYTLRHRPPTERVKEIFFDLYSQGYTPACALFAHKIKLQQQYTEDDYQSKIEDGAFVPSKRTCYELYYKFKKKQSESPEGQKRSKAKTSTVTSIGEPSILENEACYVETSDSKKTENSIQDNPNDETTYSNKSETENSPSHESEDMSITEIVSEDSTQPDIPEIIDHIMQFCNILEQFVREKPEAFAAPVEQFIKNFDDLESEADLVNALTSFGQIPTVLTRADNEEAPCVQLNSDHSYYTDEQQELGEITVNKMKKNSISDIMTDT